MRAAGAGPELWPLEVRPRAGAGHKRKRRDRFPDLAASHAPSTSVRRTRRGARLATTPERAANGQWNAGSPPATTILGARPIHAHGPFASDPSTVSRQHPPLERGRGVPSKTSSRNTPKSISSFRHREAPCGASLHLMFPAYRGTTKLREVDFLPRRDGHQARESHAGGGLAG